MPCSLTVEYLGDDAWSLTSGLPANVLDDLKAFALNTWVFAQQSHFNYTNPMYVFDSALWYGEFGLLQTQLGSGSYRNFQLQNLDGVPGCGAIGWSGGSGTTFFNYIRAKRDVANYIPVNVSLPSGAVLWDAVFGFVPENSYWLMPFSYGSWCGQSSFSYEFRQPRNTAVPGQSGTFTAGWRFSVEASEGVVSTATLRGGLVRFSW